MNTKTKQTSGQPPFATKGLRLAFKSNETCELLGISRRSLTDLVKRGLLRPSCALGHLLFSTDEIKRFLNETMLTEGGAL